VIQPRTLPWMVKVAPILAFACEFSGDRSLGSVVSSAGSSPITATSAVPQAGGGASTTAVSSAGGISIEIPEAGAPTSACNPAARQSECAVGQFCALDSRCGRDQAPMVGMCKARPVECPDDRQVVCGCDGQFHDHHCLAERDGISVSDLSRCEPRICRSDADCGEFADGCVYAVGASVTGTICQEGICVCGGATVVL
jgi:hypothetical protein